MSNIVSGIAQKRVIGSSPRKSVLMLMAACASDDGTGIWTSKANMASDLEMSKRTVQSAIMDMVGMGVIYVAGRRSCKNGYTVEYGINLSALSALKCTRAADAPVHDTHPTHAADAPQDVQQMHPNNPLTIHEPSIKSKAQASNSIIQIIARFTTMEAAESFVKYRKGHKSKGLSETAANRLANSLQDILNAGHDPSDALGLAEERGWASVSLEWYENSVNKTKQSNGGRNEQQSTNKSQARMDAFIAGARS